MKSIMESNTPQRQHPRTSATSNHQEHETPSYASPTISSRAKILPQSPSEDSSSPRRPQNQSLSHRDFKTCRLSTEASRRRSRSLGPFRFLDLPPDIRNLIYEYMIPSRQDGVVRYGSRRTQRHRYEPKIFAWHGDDRIPALALPALLLVKSKQIRNELGSYIFTQKDLVFTSWTRAEFVSLLRLIGFANCQRLVQNDKVTFQVRMYRCIIDNERRDGCRFPILMCRKIDWTALSTFVDVDTLWNCSDAQPKIEVGERPRTIWVYGRFELPT